jgi:hypothetical protein
MQLKGCFLGFLLSACQIRARYAEGSVERHATAPKSEVAAHGIGTLTTVPETSYAQCGDLSLAYQVFGDGPIDLVYAGSFVSHVELLWTMPEFEAFMERLSTFCRVVLFDKAGVGLSDPVPQVRTLDDRAAEIEAVMDAVGFGKAVIFGVSEGGPVDAPALTWADLGGCSPSGV